MAYFAATSLFSSLERVAVNKDLSVIESSFLCSSILLVESISGNSHSIVQLSLPSLVAVR